MGMVKIAMRMALLRGEMLDSVLRSLHGVLPGVKEPNSYATVAGLQFATPGVVEYATAGHLPILHYRYAARATERLSIEQFPVGLIPAAEYRAAKVECGRDIFALVTDGIVEVANAPTTSLDSSAWNNSYRRTRPPLLPKSQTSSCALQPRTGHKATIKRSCSPG